MAASEFADVVVDLLGDIDDDDFMLMFLAAAYDASTLRLPKHNRVFSAKMWVADLLQAPETRFHEHTRMSRDCFGSFLDLLKTRAGLESSAQVTVEEKLMIFCIIMSSGCSQRGISNSSNRGQFTVSFYFHQVLAATVLVSPLVITGRFEGAVPARVLRNPAYSQFFPDCVGLVDGVHVDAAGVPVREAQLYINRKGKKSQNVLVVCDHNMMIIYVLAGWEGSAHDARVYSDALHKGLNIPAGKYLLADAGYPLTEGTLTPYRGVLYHGWLGANRVPSSRQELYNMRHASLRNAIERLFGILKKQYQILVNMRPYSLEHQADIVYAACVMYNWRKRHGELFHHDAVVPPPGQAEEVDESEDSREMSRTRDRISARMWEAANLGRA